MCCLEKKIEMLHLIHTLAWRERKAKFIVKAEVGVMDDVLVRLVPLIGADKVIGLYH